jgi:hypothetical protein
VLVWLVRFISEFREAVIKEIAALISLLFSSMISRIMP